jgi:hypothetical protein
MNPLVRQAPVDLKSHQITADKLLDDRQGWIDGPPMTENPKIQDFKTYAIPQSIPDSHLVRHLPPEHSSIALIYHAVLATEWPISRQVTHSAKPDNVLTCHAIRPAGQELNREESLVLDKGSAHNGEMPHVRGPSSPPIPQLAAASPRIFTDWARYPASSAAVAFTPSWCR